MSLKDSLGSPRFIRKLNLTFTIVWFTLIIPTLTVWTHSVLWVAILSIWANVISHYTAWVAARVEVRAQDLQEKDRRREEAMASMVSRLERQNLELLEWSQVIYFEQVMEREGLYDEQRRDKE